MEAPTLPQGSTMMALGLFVFGLRSLPYQQLQRIREWRHPSTPRVGRRPARQYVGPGDDKITLSGVLYPELTGGKKNIDALAAMADTGQAWPLIAGDGTMFGYYVIEKIGDDSSLFFADGAARKIDFTIELSRVDDGDTEKIGDITQDMVKLLR